MTFSSIFLITVKLFVIISSAETLLNYAETSAIIRSQESACSRCAACTAISLKLNDFFHENASFSVMNLPSEEQVRYICNFAFLKYRVWQVDEMRFVGLRTMNAQPVPDTEYMPEKLKEMCNHFVNLLPVRDLYGLWSNCRGNLFVPLCLSSRPLSSCVGVISEGKRLKRFLSYSVIMFPVGVMKKFLEMSQYDESEEEEYRVLKYWTSVGNSSSCYD